jgi:iron-sulfur cluster assembly protein
MITATETQKPVPRPRPQVMRLTEGAASRIRDILSKSDKPIEGARRGG